MQYLRNTLLLLFTVLVLTPSAFAQKYGSFQEAWAVGVTRYNKRMFEQSRAPFEAAFKLAETDRQRLQCSEALKASYRLLPTEHQMRDCCEYIMVNAATTAGRNNTGRELLGFMYQRGKIKEAQKRYEQMLEKDGKNTVALFMLSEIYDKITKEPAKAAEITLKLTKIDSESDGTPTKGTADGKISQTEVFQKAKAAAALVKAGKHEEGAKLFETIAPHLESTEPWNWKEAAFAWEKAGDQKNLRKALEMAAKTGPEKRNDLLGHFWHRQMGQIYVRQEMFKEAIPMFEKAIELTNIEGYAKDTAKELEAAKAKQ